MGSNLITVNNHGEQHESTKQIPKRIAMYVIYDKDGELDSFRKFFLKELKKFTDCIVAVVSGSITPENRRYLEREVDGVYVRENEGLLAGSWLDGIRIIGWEKIYEYDELLMLNDSFFGPIYPLDDMFDAMEQSDADFYGAFKNFAEKSYSEIGGRPLKYGYMRGTICYFYIIKKRLLHSPEFKQYWSQKTKIKGFWDTVFFAEIEFFDYIKDAGYIIDAYQGDNLKGYLFDNLSHSMIKLVRDEKIPFVRIRPFGSDEKNHALMLNYAKDTRETLEYITNNTQYNENYIWAYLLRTKNMRTIQNQLQLNYIIPDDYVQIPYKFVGQLAAVFFIQNEYTARTITTVLSNFPKNTKFFIAVDDEKIAKFMRDFFKQSSFDYSLEVIDDDNAEIYALTKAYSKVISCNDFDYVCYFHDDYTEEDNFEIIGDNYNLRSIENLFGSTEVVCNIINLFEDNPRLGVVCAPPVYHGNYFMAQERYWKLDYPFVADRAEKLGLKIPLSSDLVPPMPYNSSFWFRPESLKDGVDDNSLYDVIFPKRKRRRHDDRDDQLIRIFYYLCMLIIQSAGYYLIDVRSMDNARADISNYQYMLSGLYQIFLKHENYPISFEMTKQLLEENLARNISESNIADSHELNENNSISDLQKKLASAVKNWKSSLAYSDLLKEKLEEEQEKHAETVKNWKSSVEYSELLENELKEEQEKHAETVKNWKSSVEYSELLEKDLKEEQEKHAETVKNWKSSVEYSGLLEKKLKEEQEKHAETVKNWQSALEYIDQLKKTLISERAQYESNINATKAELEEQKQMNAQLIGSKRWKLVHPLGTIKKQIRRRKS